MEGSVYRGLLNIGVLLLSGACSPAPAMTDGAAASDLSAARDMVVLRDMATPPDLKPASYPPGPYGFMPGDTITPLLWEGYQNPDPANLSASTYAAYSMDDLRKSGAPYAMVHISEYF